MLVPHVVERERWSRVSRATGQTTGGTVLVRYTVADGLIRNFEETVDAIDAGKGFSVVARLPAAGPRSWPRQPWG